MVFQMNEIKDKHSQSDTKHKIFFAAADLFARDGYHKVSVREICEVAKVTKPVLYYYFKDKENLLEQLVLETHYHLDNLRSKHINKAGNLEDILRGIVELYKEFLVSFPHLIKFSGYIQSSNVPQRILDIKVNRYKSEMGDFIKLLSDSIAGGVISKDLDPELLALNFIGTIVLLLGENIITRENHEILFNKMNKFVDFWINAFLKKS